MTSTSRMVSDDPAVAKTIARLAHGYRPGALDGFRALPIALNLTRAHLPIICRDLGFTRGAEIGVWKGAYTATFCECNPKMHMLAVDPWMSYPAWEDSKNKIPATEGQRMMNAAFETARARLKRLNCTIVRQFSADAAATVADRSLDLLYVDGNHSEAAVREDLDLWVPKVRSGGLCCGHDYRAFTNKPTIHVIEAVQAYTKQHAIDPWFITAADRTPSFLWVVN